MEHKKRRMTSAKSVSKTGMVFGAVIIILYNLVYLFMERKIPTAEEQKSIIMLGGSIVVIFSPVYLCIALDKIGGMINRGNRNE